MEKENADIYCLQETKAKAEQVGVIPEGIGIYYSYWNSAERGGYSGVATFTQLEPKMVINDGESEDFYDKEGRVLVTKFDEFTLLNVYFPNGKKNRARLMYKLDFYDHFLKYINSLRDRGEKIVFCGDVNTAHSAIDLARPEANEGISGFLPIEREWLDKLEKNGYVDTYRLLHPEEVEYSWWSPRSGARKRNVGWRIDYVFVDESLKDRVKEAFILDEVEGSDHAPVGIGLEI